MARRYYFSWKDVNETLYRVDISSDLYTGAELEINGYGTISRNTNDDIYQAIQSTILDLTMIATLDDPLEDIYNEDDRYWSVILYKDSVEQFRGMIESQEVEQDFVSDSWEIRVECIDAIGILENFAFVDTGGLHWTGSDTVMGTIAKAVKRGFRDQTEALGFLVNTGLTLSDNSVFQENAYVDMEVFFDDNDEPNSCKEVVEQLLESMGCVMFQYLGDWVILNVEFWADMISLNVTYREYDEDGTYLSASSFGAPFASNRDIGSHINGNAIFHVNKNQSYINRKYYQTVRLLHNYEYKDQIVPNGEIEGGTAGVSMPKWTLDLTYADPATDQILLLGVATNPEIEPAATTQAIKLNEGAVIKITMLMEYFDAPFRQDIEIKLDNGTSTRYYRKNFGAAQIQWQSSQAYFTFNESLEGIEVGQFTHTIEVEALPFDGDLTITFLTPQMDSPWSSGSGSIIHYCHIEAVQVEEGIEKTSNRTDNDTGQVPDVKEIRFATTDTSVIKNTFFDSSGDFIEFVKFDGGSNTSSLQALIDSKMELFKGRFSVFSGDVMGNIDNITPNSINTLGSVYLLTRYSKDLRTDISSMELTQINRTVAGVTRTNTSRIVYSKSIKPKIV